MNNNLITNNYIKQMSKACSINVRLHTSRKKEKHVYIPIEQTSVTQQVETNFQVTFFDLIHLNVNAFTATDMEAKMCNPVTITTSKSPLQSTSQWFSEALSDGLKRQTNQPKTTLRINKLACKMPRPIPAVSTSTCQATFVN